MSGSVNKVILIGNLGADPELRSFQNGGRICNLRLATSETWNDRASGERKERTEWHQITVSGDGLIGVCERYLRKGKKIYIEGSLRTRKWQDQAGHDRFTTEIIVSGPNAVLTMLDSAGGSEGNGRSASNNGSGSARRRPGDQGYIAPVDDYEDAEAPPF